jgi:hypothetical protein
VGSLTSHNPIGLYVLLAGGMKLWNKLQAVLDVKLLKGLKPRLAGVEG